MSDCAGKDIAAETRSVPVPGDDHDRMPDISLPAVIAEQPIPVNAGLQDASEPEQPRQQRKETVDAADWAGVQSASTQSAPATTDLLEALTRGSAFPRELDTHVSLRPKRLQIRTCFMFAREELASSSNSTSCLDCSAR